MSVNDGLFNVMLGSIAAGLPEAIQGHDELYLGITVGTDTEMVPRVQLGTVPFSMQAMTVPDGSITSVKIADEAVTGTKVADGAVTTDKVNIDADLDAHGYDIRSIRQLWTNGRIEVGLDGAGEGGELKLATGTTGNYWVIDNYYGTLRAYHDEAVFFTLDPNGNLWAAGTKSAVVQTRDFGQRKLYAVESPEVRFADEGLSQLRDGVARVELDPILLETIEGDYLVYVTPYGDASLYVAEIGNDHFVVKVREGDPNIAFAWRLSAHRQGYADVRLEEVGSAGDDTP